MWNFNKNRKVFIAIFRNFVNFLSKMCFVWLFFSCSSLHLPLNWIERVAQSWRIIVHETWWNKLPSALKHHVEWDSVFLKKKSLNLLFIIMIILIVKSWMSNFSASCQSPGIRTFWRFKNFFKKMLHYYINILIVKLCFSLSSLLIDYLWLDKFACIQLLTQSIILYFVESNLVSISSHVTFVSLENKVYFTVISFSFCEKDAKFFSKLCNKIPFKMLQ